LAEPPARIPGDDVIDFDQWMTRFAELDEAAVEDLLRGDTPVGCDDLAPVAQLTTAVRQRATAVSPTMGPALRAQIQQPRPVVPPRHVGSRRRLQAAVAAVTLAVVGVAAAQNALPAAAQRFVAAAADLVGLDVPRPDERVPDPSSPATDASSTDPTDPTDPTGPTERPDGRATNGDDPAGRDTPAGTDRPPEETPGGATPADPGTPGDREPATPAVPPPHSSGGSDGTADSGDGTIPNANANENATGNGASAPDAAGSGPGKARGTASED
jgi:hypothetical protein